MQSKVPYIFALLFLFLTSSRLVSQQGGTGSYPFGTFDSRGFDTINPGNNNIHFEIPIINKPGRGLRFAYSFVYDGLIWSNVNSNGPSYWQPDPHWGFKGELNGSIITGYLTSAITFGSACPRPNPPGSIDTYPDTINDFAYHDPNGGVHVFNYSIYQPCAYDTSGNPTFAKDQYSGDGSSNDGSGYRFAGWPNEDTVYTRSGSTINVPYNASSSGSISDTNGNTISNNGNGTFTDTLGVTELTTGGSGTAASPLTLTYPVAMEANGATKATATVYYKTYTIQTNFQAYPVAEYGPLSIDLIDHITLADGPQDTYNFTYEATPGVSGTVTGRIASVTLPSGGIISYTYSGNGSKISGFPDGTALTLSRTTSDGTRSYQRANTNNNDYTTTVQDEKGNQTLYHFVSDANGNYESTHEQVYPGAVGGTPLKEVLRCYNSASGVCDNQILGLPITHATIATSYNGGSQDLLKSTYDTNGNQTNTAEYSGSTLLAQNTTSYNSQNEVTGSLTTDPSGAIITSVTYGYDETSTLSTSGIPQHTSVTGSRGNQTSSHTFTGSTPIDTTAVFYDTGQPASVTTPSGTTSYGYNNSLAVAPTSTTLPIPASGVQLATSASYDGTSGVQLSATGANAGQTFTYSQYDSLLRPTQFTTPEGGQIASSFTPNQISARIVMSSSQSTDQETFLDAYGRVRRIAVASSSGWYLTDSCYDATGLLQYQSTPYVGSSPNPSGYSCAAGTGTQYTYDALNRPTVVAQSDGSSVSYRYNGRAALVSNSNGVSRLTQYDMLGQTVSVCEVSSNGNMPGSGSPSNCGTDLAGYTGFLSNYNINLAAHSTTVLQGSQQRFFQTDAIGRTTYTSEPESGVTTYSYSYNGTGLQIVRTRPKANVASNPAPNPIPTTATTYQFDKLNRLLSIAYSDGTPTKGYGYDEAGNNYNIPNMGASKGQMTNAYVNGANLITWRDFGYDIMGRVNVSAAELPDWVGQSAHDVITRYGYDLASNLVSESYGQSTTSSIASLTYLYNNAGQLTYVRGGQGSGNNGTTPYSTDPASMTPFGPQITEAGNGLFSVIGYNGTGRVNSTYVCSNSTQAHCTNGGQIYAFNVETVGSQVTASGDSLLGQGRIYNYDEFGRLTGLTTAPNSGPNIAMNFAYDRWGNRWGQNITAGSGPQPQLNFNTLNNQVNGYTYDVAGNVINDGNHTYAYDAENQLVSIDNGATASYVYDALNQRVKAATTQATERYGFDLSGRRQTAWNNNSTALDSVQYYAGSQPIAYWSSTDGNIHFEHQDWLGTERVRTTANASVEGSYSSLPFGDGAASSGTDNVPGHFALLDQDLSAGAGLSHAMFREYSSAAGRWMSPDPYAGSYDAANPQTLNRYSYVLNRPNGLIDPLGSNYIDPSGNPCFTGSVSDANGNIISTVACSTSGPSSPGGTQIPWYISEYGDQPDWFYGSPAAWAALGQKTTPAPSTAPSTAPSKTQQGISQQCLHQYNNSIAGKTVQFFSLFNLATNFKNAWLDWTVLPAAKMAVLKGTSMASQAMNGTEVLSVTGGATTTLTAPAAGFIEAGEAFAAALAGPAIAGATAADITANAFCDAAGRTGAGQMSPVSPAGYISF